MKPGKIKVGLVQTTVEGNPSQHLQKTLERVREAASRGAKLVCLQELFASPYFCQVEDAALFDLAEPIPGPTTEVVAAAARDSNVTVVASVFERRTAGIYHNSIV